MDRAERAAYRLCPRCGRAVPQNSRERFCSNDGTPMLENCPGCGAAITSPYARFCPECGLEYRPDEARRFPARATS